MTIIVTHISEHGIIHAADSNLTDSKGQQAGTGKKLFKISHLGSALTVAGNYSVGGTSMDELMETVISADKSKSLGEFVDNLRNVINSTATNDEKENGYFIHIAGYSTSGHTIHPEFYHITNYSIDPSTGDYSVLNPSLQFSEDFWSQYSSVSLKQLFTNDKGYIYCNGFPSGRITYFTLLEQMARFRSVVWANQKWRFCPPASVDEEADYLRHDMELIGLFFKHSNYSAPFIGGKIQICTIKCP